MRFACEQGDEQATVESLASLVRGVDFGTARADARRWIQALRAHPPPRFALDRLLLDYPLSSREGLALMRLAEALPRIPDAATALALIDDQLSGTDFRSADRFAGVPRRLVRGRDGGWLSRLGARAALAVIRRGVRHTGGHFVLGETLPAAHRAADTARRAWPSLRFSFDMLGEAARSNAAALEYLERYRDAIDSVTARRSHERPIEAADGVSVKLSALHGRFDELQSARVMRELLPRLLELTRAAAAAGISLTLDAEESERLDLSLELFEALAEDMAATTPSWRGLGLAVQAYQPRALSVIAAVRELAVRLETRFSVRLVKGAYWDREVKRAQEFGLAEYPVFTRKSHTDVSYLACAKALLAAPERLYPQFAGHNAMTIAQVMSMARNAGVPFELQRLHGMAEPLFRLVRDSYPEVPVRIYAPVGPHEQLLAYLVRRLLENGANSSFVHLLGDADTPVEELVRSPLDTSSGPTLPLPAALLPDRMLARGIDIARNAEARSLQTSLANLTIDPPADNPSGTVDELMRSLTAAHESWSATPVESRAAMLEACADRLEAELVEWSAHIVREGRRTAADAVAEVREAIDFCRYYAQQAREVMQPIALPALAGERNDYQLRGRGTWVCISPWNFPLAIFIGQVAAALVTGNVVAAKPAEQTPAIAARAIALLHECGIPRDALRGFYGDGSLGAALVAHPAIAGVAFTGSTGVAKQIAMTLASKRGPIVPLIAETGGINAMIVDSTALPEQMVDAVIQSCFRSAGQRCSALRVLCVQQEIAADVIPLLAGAIELLEVGDAADLVDRCRTADRCRRACDCRQADRPSRIDRAAHCACPAAARRTAAVPCTRGVRDRVARRGHRGDLRPGAAGGALERQRRRADRPHQ